MTTAYVSWLLSRKIPSSVCDALDEQNVSKEEILTYTEQDLIDLCNHLNFNIVIKKTLINAIKAIPQALSSMEQNKSIVTVFLGNEEKQQMDEFSTTTKNLKQNITRKTNELKECENHFETAKNEINKAYDNIQTAVEQARKENLRIVMYTSCLCSYFFFALINIVKYKPISQI